MLVDTTNLGEKPQCGIQTREMNCDFEPPVPDETR